MGLPLLIEKLQAIRREQQTANTFYKIADLICLDEFLKLIAINLTALAQFKNMLLGLIQTASETISIANVVIAQLQAANDILNTFLQTLNSAKTAILSKLIPFPFLDDNYLHCKIVQDIKQFLTNLIPTPDPASLIPGNAKRYAKRYKQATQYFKELEYRIFKNEKTIRKWQKDIQTLQLQILAWQAIVDAIGQQFGV